MNDLQIYCGKWANRQFPSHYVDGVANPMAPLNHLIDAQKGEVWELRKALESRDSHRIADELADCQLLLYTIAHLCGIDLEEAAVYKHMVNCNRKWGQPDAKGIVEHI